MPQRDCLEHSLSKSTQAAVSVFNKQGGPALHALGAAGAGGETPPPPPPPPGSSLLPCFTACDATGQAAASAGARPAQRGLRAATRGDTADQIENLGPRVMSGVLPVSDHLAEGCIAADHLSSRPQPVRGGVPFPRTGPRPTSEKGSSPSSGSTPRTGAALLRADEHCSLCSRTGQPQFANRTVFCAEHSLSLPRTVRPVCLM